MTKPRRWALVTVAAAIVVVAAMGGADDPKNGDYQERREYIQNLDETAKKELLEKQERFLKLPREERERLCRLHQDLQKQENRDELEQVMDAYFQWVRSLSYSERAQLNSETSPEERIKRIVRYKAAPSWDRRRHGGPGSAWAGFGGRTHEKMLIFGFFRKHADVLITWAGTYVAENRVLLADLLPEKAREEWDRSVQQAASTEGDKKIALWHALVRWYLLAGPKAELPLNKDDIEAFKNQVASGRPDTPFFEFPIERQIQGLKAVLRNFVFDRLLRDPELRSLITEEELGEYAKTHPGMREGIPNKEMAEHHVRFRFIDARLGMERYRPDDRSRGPGFSDGGRRGRSPGPGRGGPSGRGGMGGFGRQPNGPEQRPGPPNSGKPPWTEPHDQPEPRRPVEHERPEPVEGPAR